MSMFDYHVAALLRGTPRISVPLASLAVPLAGIKSWTDIYIYMVSIAIFHLMKFNGFFYGGLMGFNGILWWFNGI